MNKPNQTYNKKVTKPIKKNVVIIENDEEVIQQKQSEEPTPVNDIKLTSNWVLWYHKVTSNDWTLDSYEKLFVIHSAFEFWSVFNNLNLLGMEYVHLYLMREDVNPIWEDESNRNGGICSIKITFDESYSLFEDLCSYMVTETLLQNDVNKEINGISFSPKVNSRNSFAIVKVWSKDKNVNVIKNLNESLSDRCEALSIQYKENKPEY